MRVRACMCVSTCVHMYRLVCMKLDFYENIIYVVCTFQGFDNSGSLESSQVCNDHFVFLKVCLYMFDLVTAHDWFV